MVYFVENKTSGQIKIFTSKEAICQEFGLQKNLVNVLINPRYKFSNINCNNIFIREAHFIKSYKRDGTKFEITIEGDCAEGISYVEDYDAERYELKIGIDTDPEFVVNMIIGCLDTRGYGLTINDDHELSRSIEKYRMWNREASETPD